MLCLQQRRVRSKMKRYLQEERVVSYGALYDRADNDGNGVITRLELMHTLEVRAYRARWYMRSLGARRLHRLTLPHHHHHHPCPCGAAWLCMVCRVAPSEPGHEAEPS